MSASLWTPVWSSGWTLPPNSYAAPKFSRSYSRVVELPTPDDSDEEQAALDALSLHLEAAAEPIPSERAQTATNDVDVPLTSRWNGEERR